MEKKSSSKSNKSKKSGQNLQQKTEKIKIKRKSSFLTRVIVRIVIIMLLVSAFGGALYFASKRILKVSAESKYALVDKQLSLCQELVTAKYRYSDIVTLKKSAGFAKSYSIVKFTGIIRVGIADITDLEYTLGKNGKTIKLKLPPAEILGNELVKQEVFDEKQSIFVPITTQEIINEIEEAKNQISEDMIAEGVLEEAEEYAKRVLYQMLISCGFDEVIVSK